ncbi:MAG: right-handed parallel beta-helix repeat-containing protein [Thermoplasmata archaeon]|nr:right-handed parallel beta-helix repeat-containing protein [Thermoplasmata archaeon]
MMVALVVLISAMLVSILVISYLWKSNEHGPIVIQGDAYIDETDGVVSGSGTESDPYVIEGWEIIQDYYAVAIENTRAHIIVRNLTIIGSQNPSYAVSPSSFCGISIANCTNLTIEHCTIECCNGVYIGDSSDVTLRRNEIVSSFRICSLSGCSEICLRDNLLIGIGPFYPYSSTVEFVACKSISVTDNSLKNATFDLHELDEGQLRSLSIDSSNSVGGFPFLFRVNESAIHYDSQAFGQIILLGCTDIRLSNLSFEYLPRPITILQCSDIAISDVYMANCGIGIEINDSIGVALVRSSGINTSTCMRHSDEIVVAENDFIGESMLHLDVPESYVNITVVHNNFLNIDSSMVTVTWVGIGDPVDWVNFSFGYPSGGNYWATYAHMGDYCSGPYQNIQGADGIADTPFMIQETIAGLPYAMDPYPLMAPWSP